MLLLVPGAESEKILGHFPTNLIKFVEVSIRDDIEHLTLKKANQDIIATDEESYRNILSAIVEVMPKFYFKNLPESTKERQIVSDDTYALAKYIYDEDPSLLAEYTISVDSTEYYGLLRKGKFLTDPQEVLFALYDIQAECMDRNEPSFWSTVNQAKEVALKAYNDWKEGREVLASDEEKSRRLSICKKCPIRSEGLLGDYCDKSKTLLPDGRLVPTKSKEALEAKPAGKKGCGCYLDKHASIASEKCQFWNIA